jgi:hypothetical protein
VEQRKILSQWERENIRVMSDRDMRDQGLSLASLMSRCSLLVTDYSSVAVDFLVVGRPIVFLVRDVAEYQEGRGLNFGLTEFSKMGPIASTLDELCDILETILVGAGDGNGSPCVDAYDLFYSAPKAGAAAALLTEMTSRLAEKRRALFTHRMRRRLMRRFRGPGRRRGVQAVQEPLAEAQIHRSREMDGARG